MQLKQKISVSQSRQYIKHSRLGNVRRQKVLNAYQSGNTTSSLSSKAHEPTMFDTAHEDPDYSPNDSHKSLPTPQNFTLKYVVTVYKTYRSLIHSISLCNRSCLVSYSTNTLTVFMRVCIKL